MYVQYFLFLFPIHKCTQRLLRLTQVHQNAAVWLLEVVAVAADVRADVHHQARPVQHRGVPLRDHGAAQAGADDAHVVLLVPGHAFVKLEIAGVVRGDRGGFFHRAAQSAGGRAEGAGGEEPEILGVRRGDDEASRDDAVFAGDAARRGGHVFVLMPTWLSFCWRLRRFVRPIRVPTNVHIFYA